MNVAQIAPTPTRPFQYTIYAGSTFQNAQQGVFVVMRRVHDPCKQKNAMTIAEFLTPQQQGALTITAINGNSISFQSANGGNGLFNFVTSQFS